MKIKALAADSVDSLGDSMAFSFSIDPKSKPPFAGNYIYAVKDEDKFTKVIEQSAAMMNTGPIANFYKDLGLEISFSVQRSIENYNGVSIDSAKFVMKSTDPNSIQGQMMEQMYGGGFDYRWAMVNGLCVFVIGGDVDSAIRKQIDLAKAGGPTQIADEIKNALVILPNADRADFVGTYNYVRLFSMVTAMMPVPVQMPDIVSKSNVAFAGRVADGKLTVDIALPKEHLTEIMMVVMAMQQQMMQQMMQQQGVWICPMHPQVKMPQQGKCPMCGMDLVPAAPAEIQDGKVG